MNEYKSWSDEKLLSTGKRLGLVLKLAYEEMREAGTEKHAEYLNEIYKGQVTLDALRTEYKKRNP